MTTIACFNFDPTLVCVLRNALSATSAEVVAIGDEHGRMRKPSQIHVFHCVPGRSREFQRAALLKDSFPSTPLIITSFSSDSGVVIMALRLRAWDFVVLPHELDYLVGSVGDWITRVNAGLCQRRNNLFNIEKKRLVETVDKPDDGPSRIERAVEMIHQHLDERLYVERLAKECCMSVDTLRRCFRREYGMSIQNFIKRVRIERAASLLQQRRELSVKEVAFRVGYQDVSLFNRMFKDRMNTTPTIYRSGVS